MFLALKEVRPGVRGSYFCCYVVRCYCFHIYKIKPALNHSEVKLLILEIFSCIE